MPGANTGFASGELASRRAGYFHGLTELFNFMQLLKMANTSSVISSDFSNLGVGRLLWLGASPELALRNRK